VNGAQNGDAGTPADGPSESGFFPTASARAERMRLLKAGALGFALGLLLVRWAGTAPRS
jgi:hypothetical protein